MTRIDVAGDFINPKGSLHPREHGEIDNFQFDKSDNIVGDYAYEVFTTE